MFPVIICVVSVFIFSAFFFLLKAVSEKPECNVIITALSAEDIAGLLYSAGDAKASSVYIVTNEYNKKYFDYLKKHYFVKEVLTVVDGNN